MSRTLKFLPALLVLLIVQGCAVSPRHIRRADAVVAATVMPSDRGCLAPTRCAEPSPLLAAAHEALARSTPARQENVVTLLAASDAALAARVNLIRAARRSIDVQNYIWDQDDVGQMMLDQLVQAARRGVQVRILVDQLFSFDSPPLLNRLARVDRHLQVRLYNPTFNEAHTSSLEWAAGILCCFTRFNQRMHNKLLVVDDAIGITGGRNYQDRYFNWDPVFDYFDRDVMVGGAAAADMTGSFDRFWNHPRSVPLTHLHDVNRYILSHPAAPGWPAPRYARPQRVRRLLQAAEDPAWLAAHITGHSLRTDQPVEYFSDLPAKTSEPQRRQALAFTQHLMQLVASARHQVLLQTPYLVISGQADRIFRAMHERPHPPQVLVSTNSLASTDAFPVYALSYKHRKRYLTGDGFQLHEMKPRAPAAERAYEQAQAALDLPDVAAGAQPRHVARTRHRRRYPVELERRGLFGSRGSSGSPAPLKGAGRRYGLHAKSIVVDDLFAMVGSHNFDPRSDHFNTEAGVIVYDRAFAEQVRASILRLANPDNAWIIAPRPSVVPVLTHINQAIGEVSEKLPLFDFWPYRYATSYQILPGCMPMAPSDPRFYSCYRPEGDFPDVDLSFKLLYTRLITAFGSGAQGIL